MARKNKGNFIKAGDEFAQKKQYEKAIVEYQKALKEDPKDTRVAHKLAEFCLKAGKLEDGMKFLGHAASLYTMSGFFKKAIPIYNQILKIDENRVNIREEIASLYYRLGLVGEALRQYCIILDFCEETGAKDKFFEMLKKIVKIDAKNPDYRIKLGQLYAERGHKEQGLSEFQRAADQLRSLQRWDDLLQLYWTIVQINPHSPEAHFGIGEILSQQGKYDEAIESLSKAIILDCKFAARVENLIESHHVKEPQREADYLKRLAEILENSGVSDTAKRFYNRASELLGENIDTPESEQDFPEVVISKPEADEPLILAPVDLEEIIEPLPPADDLSLIDLSEPSNYIKIAPITEEEFIFRNDDTPDTSTPKRLENDEVIEPFDFAEENDPDEIEIPAEDIEEIIDTPIDTSEYSAAAQPSDDPETLFNAGIAYKEMGLWKKAIGSFREAKNAGADEIQCLYMIALCAKEGGMARSAEMLLREVLKRYNLSDYYEALFKYELSLILREEGHVAEVLNLLREIEELAPDFRETRDIIQRMETHKENPKGSRSGNCFEKIFYL